MHRSYGRAGGSTFGFVPLLVPAGSGGTGSGFGTPPALPPAFCTGSGFISGPTDTLICAALGEKVASPL